MQSTLYSCHMLTKLEFSPQIFRTFSNIKFRGNPSSESRVVPCERRDGQTDMTNTTVAFRNFANAHKNNYKAYLRVNVRA
jgi:hypothetical protein